MVWPYGEAAAWTGGVVFVAVAAAAFLFLRRFRYSYDVTLPKEIGVALGAGVVLGMLSALTVSALGQLF